MGAHGSQPAAVLSAAEASSLALLLNIGAISEETSVSTYTPGAARLDVAALPLLVRRGLARSKLRPGPEGLKVGHHWLSAAGVQRAQDLQGGRR